MNCTHAHCRVVLVSKLHEYLVNRGVPRWWIMEALDRSVPCLLRKESIQSTRKEIT